MGIFETLALAGFRLPPSIGAPEFADTILALGWSTLWEGLLAVATLIDRTPTLVNTAERPDKVVINAVRVGETMMPKPGETWCRSLA